jgi:hypothetical protein
VQARLFGPAIFEAKKLRVLRVGGEEGAAPEEQHPAEAEQPRMYTLTHSDVTARLTLAVASSVHLPQVGTPTWLPTIGLGSLPSPRDGAPPKLGGAPLTSLTLLTPMTRCSWGIAVPLVLKRRAAPLLGSRWRCCQQTWGQKWGMTSADE